MNTYVYPAEKLLPSTSSLLVVFGVTTSRLDVLHEDYNVCVIQWSTKILLNGEKKKLRPLCTPFVATNLRDAKFEVKVS